MQTQIHRTMVRRMFEEFSHFLGLWYGQPKLSRQTHNATRGVGGHFFGHFEFQADQLDSMSARNDGHCRGNAGRQRSGGQIGGRKRFPPPLVVFGGICYECIRRRPVDGQTVKTSLIFAGDFDHGIEAQNFCGSSNSQKHSQGNGAPGGIRTHDHQLRRQVLYPAELRAPVQNAPRVSGANQLRQGQSTQLD